MKNCVENEIAKLQSNLLMIRKAGGWSAEEFGDMIGVTKQTISNLENKKTTMTKTQYIATRAVLDYEMSDNPDNKILETAVNLTFNSEKLSDSDIRKAQTFVGGATQTGLDSETLKCGLIAMIGKAAADTLIPIASPVLLSTACVWLAKIIKDKNN